MHSSPLAARIATADTSPIVTPRHLIAAAEALLDEMRHLLDPIRAAAENTPTPQKPKTYSSIADLRRLTGLSRERIGRILLKNPTKIRTIADSPYTPYKRYHTADFLALITSYTKKPLPQ